MVTKKTEAKRFFANYSDIADSIARNINTKTEELKHLKTFEDLTEEFKLGIIKVNETPNNSKESHDKWQKYLENNDSSIFNENNILELCFSYEVLNNMLFWNLINVDKFSTERVISYLVRNIHYFWTDLDNFDEKIEIFKTMLYRANSKREIINYWKEKPHVIVGDKNRNLVAVLADLIKHKKTTLSSLYKTPKYDIRSCDLLSNLVECEVLKAEIQSIGNNISVNINELTTSVSNTYDKFIGFIKYSVKLSTTTNRKSTKSLILAKNDIIAEVILLIDKLCNKNDSFMYYKNSLLDFVVENLGDPRIINWEEFESEIKLKAKNIIASWLNERDIKFFFEKLIDDDPQFRKDFWIGYAPKIQESLFLLGNNVSANRKNYSDIDKFRNLMPKKFLKIGDADHNFSANVFILKIGKLYILEFSKDGNACYFYDEITYKKCILPKFNTQYGRSKLKISDLKEQYLCITNLHHRGINWKPKFKQFIDDNA